jgi:hypothetical protein
MSAPNFYNQPVIDRVFYSTPVMSSRFSEIEELPDNLPAPLAFPMGLIAPTNNDPATPSDFIPGDEMIRQSGIDFDAPDPNPYVEPEDTRVAVDIHIDYVIYLEKKFGGNQVPSKYIRCIPGSPGPPWRTNITGWNFKDFKRGVACHLSMRPKLMDAVLEADQRGVIIWKGSIHADSTYPNNRPAILKDEASFEAFAARVEHLEKSKCTPTGPKCTVTLAMDNPTQRKKNKNTVSHCVFCRQTCIRFDCLQAYL